ncbi:hypothetical protein [Kineococcus aurantiacus]|uniref:Uncharacterized protein n=1 Tax=Kineococcus aurantiacus TaxID=37633 RepID=A0A7Y9DL84_9ACTN|nr:hypothetical protein [Kineococcus aurantiacus]NYD22663.1 hypothetical protein [Kineococcus aurantiacus]
MTSFAVITATLVVVALVLLVLIVALTVRDRARDRSWRHVPHRDDWDLATSRGVGGYRHDQPGPGA